MDTNKELSFTKKKLYVAAFALLLICMIYKILPVKEAQASTSGTITVDYLNVRTGPGTDFGKVISGGTYVYLMKGDRVVIENKTSNGWYYVYASFNGVSVKGYVSASYVKTSGNVDIPVIQVTATPSPSKTPTPAPSSSAPILPCGGYVTASKLNVRTGPGTNYSSVGMIEEGTKVVVQAEVSEGKSRWYNIYCVLNSQITVGYVSADYIKLDVFTVITPSPTPTIRASKPTPTVNLSMPEAQAGYPIDGQAVLFHIPATIDAYIQNVRKGPSVDTPVITTLEKGTQITLINQVENGDTTWYRIIAEKNGDTIEGYVVSTYVNVDFTEPVFSVISGDRVRLRRGADDSMPYIQFANGNTIVFPKGIVLYTEKEYVINGVKWYLIRYYGGDGNIYRGYTMADNVSFQSTYVSPTPTNTNTTKPTNTPVVTNTPSKTPTPTPITTFEKPEYFEASEAIIGGPGKIKGIGSLSSNYSTMWSVLYKYPDYSSVVVRYADRSLVRVTPDSTLTLYDIYINGSETYRHVSLTNGLETVYGYVRENLIVTIKGESGAEDTWSLANQSSGTNPNVTPVVVSNSEFAADLRKKGFPESYIPYLEALHGQYPNWTFTPLATNLTWKEVIAAENVVGKNLITNSRSSGYKSVAEGAYNWTTKQYIPYDGKTWVTASKEAIEYYMDPRNWLNETHIFMFQTLTYSSISQNVEGVEKILEGTPFEGASYSFIDDTGRLTEMTFAETLMYAGKRSYTSPYLLATRLKQEVVISPTQVSNSVTGKVAGYEGYYNFFNIGAYHSTEENGAIINGLKYAMYGGDNWDLNNDAMIPWYNEYRSIVGGSFIIANQYVLKGQNTLYTQKFNVTYYNTFGHQYMSNVEAPMSEAAKLAAAYEGDTTSALSFSIPVYLKMPETPCEKPGVATGINCILDTLEVYDVYGNEMEMESEFDPYSTDTIKVIAEAGNIVCLISANPKNPEASVDGNGYYELELGNNYITITVEGDDKSKRTYTLNVYLKR